MLSWTIGEPLLSLSAAPAPGRWDRKLSWNFFLAFCVYLLRRCSLGQVRSLLCEELCAAAWRRQICLRSFYKFMLFCFFLWWWRCCFLQQEHSHVRNQHVVQYRSNERRPLSKRVGSWGGFCVSAKEKLTPPHPSCGVIQGQAPCLLVSSWLHTVLSLESNYEALILPQDRDVRWSWHLKWPCAEGLMDEWMRDVWQLLSPLSSQWWWRGYHHSLDLWRQGNRGGRQTQRLRLHLSLWSHAPICILLISGLTLVKSRWTVFLMLSVSI